ncbi:MAG: thioredoxin [Bacilli bacterium]|jgi:thioredoxin 1
MIIKVQNAQEFRDAIKEGKVLVDFYADWCGPCKMQGPVLEQYDAGSPKAKIVKLNVDMLPDLAGEYGVYSIPTLILFVNGAISAKNVGFLPLSPLTRFIDGH